jgi:calcineurin-like phosphoesterase family protein
MKDRDIFVIGDTHLGHENILKFKSGDSYLRGRFDSIKEHDDCICDNWNSTVRDQDIVYLLGDVGFGDFSAVRRLRGRKRLILGNHDSPSHPLLVEVFGKRMGVWRMFPEYRCVLTHIPIHLGDTTCGKYDYNIHGHIHDNPSPTEKHICVSCEQVDYTPVKMHEALGVDRMC